MALILIADDDASYAGMVATFLETKGHTVHTAGGVLELLRLLNGKTPDLFILDVNMPGGGGPGAAKILVETPRTVKTPILILSVMPVEEQKKHFPTASHMRFFSKKSELSELGAAVDALIGKP